MERYTDRRSRHEYISQKYKKYIKGNIINIGGGGHKHLKQFVNISSYTELDIAGNPDLKIDLDNVFPLPINSNSYDTVICTEVLEHLEEFHRVFEELLRISKKYIIISVPNALISYRSYFLRKKYYGDSGIAGKDVGMYKKYYGLPLVKPADRHRWFFSFTEAEYYFMENQKLGYKIINQDATGKSASSILGKLIRWGIKQVVSINLFKDLFYSSYWVVLEKINEEL